MLAHMVYIMLVYGFSPKMEIIQFHQKVVMKSGRKSQVLVGFVYHFSGSGRVTILRFLSGNYPRGFWVLLL